MRKLTLSKPVYRRLTPFKQYRTRPRAAFVTPDMEYGMTADHVIEDPRQPVIMPTGVLDLNGEMLCRVIMPIKGTLGFGRAKDDVADCVETILPESMIMVSESGGLASINEDEMEDE